MILDVKVPINVRRHFSVPKQNKPKTLTTRVEKSRFTFNNLLLAKLLSQGSNDFRVKPNSCQVCREGRGRNSKGVS